MSRIRTNEAGFTLIEVLIALAIITIASVLAAPDFVRWNAKVQLRQTTAEIASQLTLARMAGMNRNRSVDVTVNMSGGLVRISAVSSTGTVIKDTSFPTRVKSVVGNPVGNPVAVSFSSMGTRTSAGTGPQSIGICDLYGRQYSVTITLSGKVNWSSSGSGTPCP
ncbi:MAG: prepilin-type N-terminal cleavage/methylation domain-containing protein [Nitrospira sp.]|nr:prepilin-type N-terminal cleavage/methylation domain-containing protein [Nitrospira sp.]